MTKIVFDIHIEYQQNLWKEPYKKKYFREIHSLKVNQALIK
jgi:hypothetical protein